MNRTKKVRDESDGLRLLSTRQVAEQLGIAAGTLRRLVSAGKLGARKRTAKGRLVFTQADLDAYFQSLRIVPATGVGPDLPDDRQPGCRRRRRGLPKGFIEFV